MFYCKPKFIGAQLSVNVVAYVDADDVDATAASAATAAPFATLLMLMLCCAHADAELMMSWDISLICGPLAKRQWTITTTYTWS